MFKPGMVVLQEQVCINNKIIKNDSRRLSVVLFSENIDGEDYVCSCPISSTLSHLKKNPQNFCRIPYLILGEKKFSVVKISDMMIWRADSVSSTGIDVELNHVQTIYNSILSFRPSKKKKRLFTMAQRYISKIDLMEAAKEEARRKKAERKMERLAEKEKRKRKAKGGNRNG